MEWSGRVRTCLPAQTPIFRVGRLLCRKPSHCVAFADINLLLYQFFIELRSSQGTGSDLQWSFW